MDKKNIEPDDNISNISDEKSPFSLEYLKNEQDNISSKDKKVDFGTNDMTKALNVRFNDETNDFILNRNRRESKLDSILKLSLQQNRRRKSSFAQKLKPFGNTVQIFFD